MKHGKQGVGETVIHPRPFRIDPGSFSSEPKKIDGRTSCEKFRLYGMLKEYCNNMGSGRLEAGSAKPAAGYGAGRIYYY